MLRKTLKVLLALTIPVGTIAVLLWLFAMNRGGDGYAPTTANTLIKVVEDKEVYMVPANYIWSGRDSGNALNGQVNFHMLYPGAEPMTKENRKQFKASGWAGGRLVTFILMPKTDVHFLERYREEEKVAREKKQITKSGDWLQMPLSIDGYVLLKAKDSHGGDIYIQCDNPSEYIKFPSCNRYFALTDSTYAHFTFSRDRLEEWQHIESELATLLNKFRTKN